MDGHRHSIDTDTVELEADVLGGVKVAFSHGLVLDDTTVLVVQRGIAGIGSNRTQVDTELDGSSKRLPGRRIVGILGFCELLAIVVNHVVVANREELGGLAHVVAGGHRGHAVAFAAYSSMELVEVGNGREKSVITDSLAILGSTGIHPSKITGILRTDIVTVVRGHGDVAGILGSRHDGIGIGLATVVERGRKRKFGRSGLTIGKLGTQVNGSTLAFEGILPVTGGFTLPGNQPVAASVRIINIAVVGPNALIVKGQSKQRRGSGILRVILGIPVKHIPLPYIEDIVTVLGKFTGLCGILNVVVFPVGNIG